MNKIQININLKILSFETSPKWRMRRHTSQMVHNKLAVCSEAGMVRSLLNFMSSLGERKRGLIKHYGVDETVIPY